MRSAILLLAFLGVLCSGAATASAPVSKAVAIAAGVTHACAVTDSGGAKCWGANARGQIGDGTWIERHVPRDVHGFASGAAAVSAGNASTCALTNAGVARCWGENFNGQVGDGTTVIRNAPVDVSGLASGVRAISAGDKSSCALTSAGGVKCWGSNCCGQLGDGTSIDRHTPVDVVGLTSGVTAIAANGGYTARSRAPVASSAGGTTATDS